MDELGLGYEELSQSNPGLVYCSISGLGEQGPMAQLPATEVDVQALTGKFTQLGRPQDPPSRLGVDIVSANAAWAAGQAIVVALLERERTGQGQRVWTSLLDAAVNLMQWGTAAESNPDEWKGRQLSGYTDPPDHGFRCKDAHFLLDLGRVDEEWMEFCLAVGADQVANDPRFDTFAHRLNWLPTITDMMEPALSSWTFRRPGAAGPGHGGTIVRMHDFGTLMDHPQVDALEMVHQLEHPVAGRYETLDVPWGLLRAHSAPLPCACPSSGPAHKGDPGGAGIQRQAGLGPLQTRGGGLARHPPGPRIRVR